MAMYKAVMDGDALTSSKAKEHSIASNINGVRERSEGSKTYQRAAIDKIRGRVRVRRGVPRPMGYTISFMRSKDEGMGS